MKQLIAVIAIAGLTWPAVAAAQDSSRPGECWLLSDTPALHFLKDQPLCGADHWTWSVGGSLRFRYMDERNRLRPMGDLARNTYGLWRFAPSVQVEGQYLTGFVQAIDAVSFGENLPALPIDENRADLLQHYLDFNLLDGPAGNLRFRYGRQFLQYGDQHLLSPLAWSNTYRNFEGYRLYHAGDDWTIDAFAVQPVNAAAGNIPRPASFDTPDQSVWLSGVYSTYSSLPGGMIDVYWIWLDESEPKSMRHDGRRHTIGARYAGSRAVDTPGATRFTWRWDAQGAYQFGSDTFINGGANQDVQAGFVFASGAVTLDDLPWTPTLKGLFWWGSGDDDPFDGTINTVTTLYPLGHAWWGLIDNFSGANLLDYSAEVSVRPHEKLTLLAAWHWFDKAHRRDHVYNIAGAPLGPPAGPRNIGHELDLLATWALSPYLNVQLGYFWFWYGDAVDKTALARDDAQQAYLQVNWTF